MPIAACTASLSSLAFSANRSRASARLPFNQRCRASANGFFGLSSPRTVETNSNKTNPASKRRMGMTSTKADDPAILVEPRRKCLYWRSLERALPATQLEEGVLAEIEKDCYPF